MDSETIIRWLKQYDEGSISLEDKERLFDWYSDISLREANGVFKAVDSSSIMKEFHPAMKPEMMDRLERALDLIDEENASGSGPSRVRRRSLFLSVGAVAACLLLAAGVYIFRTRSTRPLSPVVGQTAIPPGRSHAVLTLAGGQQIILDSGGVSGNIPKQGQTSVVNQNGRLAYHAGSMGTSALYNTIRTPRGGQYQLELPDGTSVWLNAASSLTYPTAFTGPTREVLLTGEGYFEVAKNARQPFIVRFNTTTVQVLGTAFDVMAYDDEPGGTQTTLVSGSVIVRKGVDKMVPEPGKTVVVNNTLSERDANIPQVIAWKNGEIALNNADLGSMMRQISRWYDVNVVFKGPVPKRRFGGVVKRNVNLETLLEFFNENGIRSSVNNREIQLYTTNVTTPMRQ